MVAKNPSGSSGDSPTLLSPPKVVSADAISHATIILLEDNPICAGDSYILKAKERRDGGTRSIQIILSVSLRFLSIFVVNLPELKR
jgi:hypothetical protein